MARNKLSVKNSNLLKCAEKVLVGGVDSPVRSFGYVGGNPLLVKRGLGSKIYDYDGNSYIDYVLSWGAVILGHAHPAVVRDAKRALSQGFSFGATNEREIELAGIIIGAIPFIDKIRFVNSGTEAVMGAVRACRGFTGRDKILKFKNSYHGHADYMLAKAGSGLATLGIPSSAGVPRSFTKETIVAPYGDGDRLVEIFKRHGKEIAAVIIEPVGANYGVIGPDYAFLEKVQRITRSYGTLLISDEVITGFRFRYGAISGELGLSPDLICLGKIIGGALPIGAYGGREDVMGKIAPSGSVYQASTFAGNPVVMQAGISTLNILRKLKDEYAALEGLAKYLVSNLKNGLDAGDIGAEIKYYKNIFGIKFRDKRHFRMFYTGMLKKGVFFAPSEFEANFLSFAHTKRDIDETIKRSKEIISGLK